MDEQNLPQSLSFDLESLGQPQPWVVRHRGLEYTGEVIIAEGVNHRWGEPLPPNLNFRLVFFTVPRRIPPSRILDTRIAMVVPGRSPTQVRQSLRRELRSIQETRERYVLHRDPDSEALRRAMIEREESLRRELERRYGMAYSQGRIYTHPEIGLRAQDLFLDTGLESWANALASATLLLAHPILPLDYRAFPESLTAQGIDRVFRGLFQGDIVEQESMRSFATGLSVTSPESPGIFDASHSPVLAILQRELEGSAGEADPAALAHTLMYTYGLTLELALFHLLVFVRQTRGELQLKLGHGLTSHRGGAFLSDRITRDLVPEVDFAVLKLGQLAGLRLDHTVDWNLALPYASLLVEGLTPSDEGIDTPDQERQLVSVLMALRPELTAAKSRIAEISAGLGSAVGAVAETLERLKRMSFAEDLQGFYAVVEREFDGPSDLSEALGTLQRVASLSDYVPAIIEARNYLDRMTFGLEHQDLRLVRDSLMARLDAASLISNPSLWHSINEGLERLRGNFSTTYSSFHATYHQEALELRHQLETLTPQVNALARFNEIPELGEPVGTEVHQMFKDVSEGYRLCGVAEGELDLGDVPYCRSCILPMNVAIPHRSVEQLSGEVARALREYNRRLSTHSAMQILDRPTREQLDKFIELVQVADPSALANVLDDRVVEFLRQFLSNNG